MTCVSAFICLIHWFRDTHHSECRWKSSNIVLTISEAQRDPALVVGVVVVLVVVVLVVGEGVHSGVTYNTLISGIALGWVGWVWGWGYGWGLAVRVHSQLEVGRQSRPTTGAGLGRGKGRLGLGWRCGGGGGRGGVCWGFGLKNSTLCSGDQSPASTPRSKLSNLF